MSLFISLSCNEVESDRRQEKLVSEACVRMFWFFFDVPTYLSSA
jgi:hypothetical protein